MVTALDAALHLVWFLVWGISYTRITTRPRKPRDHRGMPMAVARLKVQPIEVEFRLTSQTYKALKHAITSMNI